LYLIRNINPENPEFIELKADRQPIGIHINEKEFSNHKIQLEKGDALYIFSDGYIDQFGGEAGGKYKTVRFKEMLLSIQDRSMVDQKFALEQTFTKWKRDLKQVDDVLVMGMKI
jgi:serine phosphatase RsbU (regulator of sigma subunit)